MRTGHFVAGLANDDHVQKPKKRKGHNASADFALDGLFKVPLTPPKPHI